MTPIFHPASIEVSDDLELVWIVCEKMIYVTKYDHVEIKEQQGALQWELWGEHVQLAPPGLDAGQVGQVNDVDARIYAHPVLCEAVELIGHGDVTITHSLEYIHVVG